MKRIKLITFLGIIGVLAACQAVFTYSPFTFLQRDIDSIPVTERIARAKEALGSGDTAQMAEAYAVIEAMLEESDDPELYLLAADLAFGASGMTEVFAEALENMDSIDEPSTEDMTEVLESLNLDLISEGVTHLETAINDGAEVSDTQYVIAGAAMLASAVEKAGSFAEVGNLTATDEGYDDYQDAQAYLEAGGEADLLDMFGL